MSRSLYISAHEGAHEFRQDEKQRWRMVNQETGDLIPLTGPSADRMFLLTIGITPYDPSKVTLAAQ